jgi:ATP-dependent DNA helicase RecQ
MVTLKAGYYIDEFDKLLLKVIDQKYLGILYEQKLFFEVSGLPHYLDFTNVNPLFKVAWNIINRGEPTRASLFLANNIIRKHLDEEYFAGIETNKPNVVININPGFIKNIDSKLLTELIENFENYNEEIVALSFGEKYLKVFRILTELILCAQLQKFILLLLFSKLIGETDLIQVIGVRPELVTVLLEDLNNIFSSLNKLVSDDEKKVPLINSEIGENVIKISIGKNAYGNFQLLPFQKSESVVFDKILTDRGIKYESLGEVLEKEENNKYIQEFKYADVQKKEAILFLLQNIFRKSKFKPGQEAIINRAIQNKNVIGLLPTGGGKSLTYQICAILQPGITVVVDPINSLMKDQYDKLIEIGFTKVSFINSFNSKEERLERIEKLAKGKFQIIFVSPERFQIEEFRNSLKGCLNNDVFFSYAVIDEAHCVSEWGHDFRHTYLKLAQNLKRFCIPKNGELTTFGLTATASFDVLADVQRELEMTEDAIITLPAEAIDRKELNFEIHKVEGEAFPESPYWEREKWLGFLKYPLINKLIQRIPEKIRQYEEDFNYLQPSANFYEKNQEGYSNSGVIFCPTKSNKLPNGVVMLKKHLEKVPYLEIASFFGSADENTIVDEELETEAGKSFENQEKFIKNEKNLMIATKAFGMGIDKPNIRYSVHYSFPNSVESFYQEAGRAGRDGFPSICSILFHPFDRLTNYDFYQNSFKGIQREIEIINELLDEVKYEDNFFVQVLKRWIQEKYPEVHSVNLYNDRYLYLNGPFKENRDEKITIGTIDLLRDLKSYDDSIKNFDPGKAKEILQFAKEFLRKEAPNGDYLAWLKTKSKAGIKTMLETGQSERYILNIGFTNDTITRINEKIRGDGNFECKEVVIRAAYNFSSDGDEFISNLEYQYQKQTGFTKAILLSEETKEFLLQNYYKIRNASDTQRAIYRMTIAGIIDDYVIDYVGRFIEVRFKAKPDLEYIENLKTYYKRYLGNQTTEARLKKIETIDDPSVLKKVLYNLIEFIDDVIADKRKRSIDYMEKLCELGLEKGDKGFRENIIYYFTSKYARTDYLPKDTDGGRIENTQIVKKYLEFISAPPDGLGGEIDNAKHLRGACENLRISMPAENASIDLLTSFSLFALEANASDTQELAEKRPFVKDAIGLYRKGFLRLIENGNENWYDIKSLLEFFNKKILDINPVVEPLIEPLTEEILIFRTRNHLFQFLSKFE